MVTRRGLFATIGALLTGTRTKLLSKTFQPSTVPAFYMLPHYRAASLEGLLKKFKFSVDPPPTLPKKEGQKIQWFRYSKFEKK